jgi:hypothetical protein
MSPSLCLSLFSEGVPLHRPKFTFFFYHISDSHLSSMAFPLIWSSKIYVHDKLATFSNKFKSF